MIDNKDNLEAQRLIKVLGGYLGQAWMISGRPLDPEGPVKHVRIMLAWALDRCFDILKGKDAN